jgi:peptidyl-prolyl cis-trans isomerase C
VRTRLFVPLVIAALAVIPACNKDKTQKPAAGSTPTAAASTATTPAATPGAPGTVVPAVKAVPAQLPEIVAKVNGQAVKRVELELAIRNLEGRAGGPIPAEQRDTVYRQVLDRIVGYHLLVQAAKAQKFTAAPWDVDKQLTAVKQQFPNEQAFNEMLQQRGLTADQLRDDTGNTLIVNQLLEKEFEGKLTATDADARKFFDENKPRFHEEASVQASHILIRLEQNADVAAREKARAQINGVLAQLKKGANFAETAKKNSQDPGSAANGGDLGFFAKNQMVPAFAEAAFKTKPGQMTGVVETPFGFHIIKVTGTKPARDVGFDEVKGQIREYLVQQQRDQRSQAFVDQLKAKGKIEVLI